MTLRVLATDFDGTIAFDGKVHDDTVTSLRAAAASGLELVLVTGRELSGLFNTFEHGDIFRFIVAENGAVLYDPQSRRVETLAPPPPPALLDRLTRQQVPISVGHTIVATVEPYAAIVSTAIRELGLNWHVILNKESIMALPSDVTKATGLSRALQAIQVSWDETIAVGDAENDLALLRPSGRAVAVQNALPSLKAIADLVTERPGGAGVAELLASWSSGTLQSVFVNPVRNRDRDRSSVA